jgi:SAM-dependent methyltransferase
MTDYHDHLARIARCPITKQDLRFLNRDELTEINTRITEERLTHFNSTPIQAALEEGLITADGTIVYLVADEIALLLPEFAISLTPNRLDAVDVPVFHASVREFYDNIGWQQRQDGFFEDAYFHEDMRPVARDYVYACQLRVNDYLPRGGEYLLDVASGPIQYESYLTYSEGYCARVCVDVSWLALQGAKKMLPPGHGVFVMGNIINLPFKPGVFDGIVSLHTIYHIEGKLQPAVFDELHRTLRPKGRAVAAYTWANTSPLNQPCDALSSLYYGIINRLGAWLRPDFTPRRPSELPEFFYDPQTYRWFSQQRWNYPFLILCWRSISVDSLRMFFHHWMFGKLLLRIIFALEGLFPRFFAPLGQYPMFVVEKE